ncbi:ABC transporter [Actinorhabdospora filicis]|uniref:ABC transporter n=1 Tax=Actinorhabdospora filicis TaxID=1785913 RepID=A0A9W6W2P5_9ACTN|nr:ABC transporter ATP-binding protein [Actinorhabdospora filicis]GLZ77242.1 ABC transporter [Actinorhabdospora filicis]
MSDTAIRVEGLTKRFGDVKVLHGVDLTVHKGETLAVLGPNGAGKTTAVEILAGLGPRDGGEVSVLGVDPAKAGRAWRARVGVVMQSASDLATLTVAETVRHFAGYYPDPRDPAEVIEAVGLTEHARRRVGKLSGGQRRRVDVALGIIGRPELLFLDEPTTGFDPEARQRFWELIRLLSGEGTTILLTTHYLGEAEALADRVAVIASGVVEAVGTVGELRAAAGDLVEVTWRDGAERTEEPTALVTKLAAHYGGEVPGLNVRRPSLEDVYLAMIKEQN